LPDFSNIHQLERGLNWTTLAYAIFVCLAAATSLLLALFAGRVTAAKNHELKLVESTSAEAVAQAQAGSARANAQALMAHTEQRRLEADIAHARAHHEQLRKETLELQLALEKERAARVQLEQRSAFRHISTGQKQVIQSELAGFRGARVLLTTYAGDGESGAFAAEIKAALETGGMSVSMAPALVYGKSQPGISMEVGANRRPLAMALAKAFVDAGVSSGPITAAESDDRDLLEIMVGPKL
jgi:hypothetical protein